MDTFCSIWIRRIARCYWIGSFAGSMTASWDCWIPSLASCFARKSSHLDSHWSCILGWNTPKLSTHSQITHALSHLDLITIISRFTILFVSYLQVLILEFHLKVPAIMLFLPLRSSTIQSRAITMIQYQRYDYLIH